MYTERRDRHALPKVRDRRSARVGLGRVLVLLTLAAVTVGCATRPPEPPSTATAEPVATADPVFRNEPPTPETHRFGPRPELPSFQDMRTLSEEQRREFLDWLKSPRRSERVPHRNLVDYLQERLAPVHFHDATLSASAALRRGEGNCMSLTLVTAALAELVGVQTQWRLNRSRPVYSAEGAVIYSSNHIQTRLYSPMVKSAPGRLTLAPRAAVVDFFTNGVQISGSRVTEPELAGLIYQNLAAEAFAAGDVGRAFWLAQEGLEHDRHNANLYNQLGLLHRRVGERNKAEEYLRFALDEFGDELVVLRNLYYFLLAEQRTSDALAIEKRIAELPDPDPYPLLELGDEALAQGDAGRALRLYEQARRKARHLHDPYGRIARAYLARGDLRAARSALTRGLDKAMREDVQQRYRSKLDRLKQLANG